jgi:hypothetical protein
MCRRDHFLALITATGVFTLGDRLEGGGIEGAQGSWGTISLPGGRREPTRHTLRYGL